MFHFPLSHINVQKKSLDCNLQTMFLYDDFIISLIHYEFIPIFLYTITLMPQLSGMYHLPPTPSLTQSTQTFSLQSQHHTTHTHQVSHQGLSNPSLFSHPPCLRKYHHANTHLLNATLPPPTPPFTSPS